MHSPYMVELLFSFTSLIFAVKRIHSHFTYMGEIPDWVELLFSLTSLIFAVQLALIFLLSSRYSDPSTNVSPLSPSAKGFKTVAVVPVYGGTKTSSRRS